MGKSSKVNIAVMLLATFAKNKLMPVANKKLIEAHKKCEPSAVKMAALGHHLLRAAGFNEFADYLETK